MMPTCYGLVALLVVGCCAASPSASRSDAPTAGVSTAAVSSAGASPATDGASTAPLPGSTGVRTSTAASSSGRALAAPAEAPSGSQGADGATAERDAANGREQLLAGLAATAARRRDPFCEPRVSPELAEVLYRTAKNLIRAHGDHVSDGELDVILPLLRLAAHSGHRPAQATYGQYVVGYYATDEMFWPTQPEVAADALAMLRVVSADEPGIVGPEYAALYLKGMLPADPEEPLPKAWLKRAQKVEEAWRRCEGLP